ncbi:MAG: class I SAM-dependent methyltransferase [Chloroflexota bacterium]
MERHRRVRDLEVAIPGARRTYLIAAPADPDAVLDELAAAQELAGLAEPEPHLPYWATPWASGLALAEVVLARQGAARGRRVLELGCGLGTTAAAALEALDGAGTLTAADCIAETLAYCRYNALRNAGRAPRLVLADWRTERGREALLRVSPFDLVLAADVLYEPEDVTPLLELAPRLTGPGGAFWLAEPGRTTSARFVEAARARGWQEETEEMERDWPAGAGLARVRVHCYGPFTG